MLAKRTRIRAAKLLLGLFLFAQGMVAVAACDWGGRSAARAIATVAGLGEAPCHDAAQGMGANVCVMHCLTGSQNLEKPAFNLPALAPAPVLVLHARLERAMQWAGELRPALAGPPPRILFRTLLI